MATKFHEGRDGLMSRCEAKVRPGGGVQGCFAEDGKGGHYTHAAMAGDGGKNIRRSDGELEVSAVDPETGLYTMGKVDGSRIGYYDGETGLLVSWRDRRSDVQVDILKRRAAVAGPSKDFVEVNNETSAQLREWFGQFERLHGVEINKYNKEGVMDAMVRAHEAFMKQSSTGNNAPSGSRYVGFMKKVVLNLVVFDRSPEAAVDDALRERMWGRFEKKYGRGR